MKLNIFLLMAALGLSIVTVRAQEPPKGWDGCIGGDVVENFIKHDLDDADSFKYADSTDAPLWIAPVSETAYHLITVPEVLGRLISYRFSN